MSPSPTPLHTITPTQALCPADSSDEPRSKLPAAQNQVEIVVTTNKMDAPGNQGNNQVVLQLNLQLDPSMSIAMTKPGGNRLVRQESVATREGTPLSSEASYSWPLSRHHSLERPHPLRPSPLERSCSMPTSSVRSQRGEPHPHHTPSRAPSIHTSPLLSMIYFSTGL